MILARRVELFNRILAAHDRGLYDDHTLFVLLATAWVEGDNISEESEQTILNATGENT
tara:strand:- start:4471 stop:4644 length:174 start_codon:yes stop_codon:yes gene_type:complete